MKKDYIKVLVLVGVIMLALGVFSQFHIGNNSKNKVHDGKNNQKYDKSIVDNNDLARKNVDKIFKNIANKRKLSISIKKKVINNIGQIYSIINKDATLSQKNKIAVFHKCAFVFFINDKISKKNSNPKDTEKFSKNKVYNSFRELYNFFTDSNEDVIKKEKLLKILENNDYKAFISSDSYKEYVKLLKEYSLK